MDGQLHEGAKIALSGDDSQWTNKIVIYIDLVIANRSGQIKSTWYLYKVGNYFPRKSLKTTIVEEAIRTAKLLHYEYNSNPEAYLAGSKDRGPRKVSFRYAADAWLKTVTQDLVNKSATLRKFLLPFFDGVKHVSDMNDIDDNMIDEYKIWRRGYWLGSASAEERMRDTNIKYKIREDRYEEPSENTLKREYPTLRQILKFAKKKGYMKHEVDVPAERSKINRRPAFVGNDYNILIDEASKWIFEAPEADIKARWRRRSLHDWIEITRKTGLRPPHELAAIQWSDIQFDIQAISVPDPTKTGKRNVPILDDGITLKLLGRMKKRRQEYATAHGQTFSENEPVFSLPDGSIIGDYGDMFNIVISRCNFPVRGDQMPYSPYSLRHSFATEQLANGMTYEMLSKVMGTSPKMLREYYDQVSVDMVRKFMQREKQ